MARLDRSRFIARKADWDRRFALQLALVQDPRFARLGHRAQSYAQVAVTLRADGDGRWHMKAETWATLLGDKLRTAERAISDLSRSGVIVVTPHAKFADGQWNQGASIYALDRLILERADNLSTDSPDGASGSSDGPTGSATSDGPTGSATPGGPERLSNEGANDSPSPAGEEEDRRSALREALFGIFPGSKTAAEKNELERLVRELPHDATATQVYTAASSWMRQYPDKQLTARALLKHWSRLVHGPASVSALKGLALQARIREGGRR